MQMEISMCWKLFLDLDQFILDLVWVCIQIFLFLYKYTSVLYTDNIYNLDLL